MSLAQLRRLDHIVATLRPIRRRIQEALADIETLEFREIPGGDGDVGFALSFLLPSKEQAEWFVRALVAENIPTWRLYNGEPVYTFPQILNQATAANYDSPFQRSF